MAKPKGKKGVSLVTFLLLVITVLIFRLVQKDHQPVREVPPVESAIPENKSSAKKKKPVKELRNLGTFTGKVIGIKDGDTFEVLYDNQPERVRLAEIDCPEKAQDFGTKAKQFASDLCFGKTVTVTNNGRDRYGRIVGTVVTEDGVNVNEELVKAGFAWHYKQYSKSEVLDAYEQQARENKVGLWSAKRPVAPWDYRRNKRNRR